MKKRFIARAYIPILTFLFAFVSVFTFFLLKSTPETSAASFNAGNIISDYVMSDYTSMTESDIQNFLKSKGSCNNTNYSLYQYVTKTYPKTTWHWENGHFVCMADESFDGESAAHIIWQAAQDFHINPKVLIVLLEKEQSLVTDSYPNSVQYRSATGYGCPDTSACDSEYYGFKNQVRNAAELYRWILDNGSKYYPVGWNYVQYNPDKSCGGSDVYIENRATSALYQYTPYQPNSAAIAAGYGKAPPCGAYGNRNFSLYYNDWFGDPTSTTSSQVVRLPDGEYSIHSLVDHDMVFDITNNETENGTNIQLWEENRTEAQKWRLEYQGNSGYFVIKNPNSGKVLDLDAANTENGTNIQLWEYNGSCAQLWKIMKSGDGYSIHSACSIYSAIDLNYANAENGEKIQLWSSNSTAAQQWDFVPFEKFTGGTYRISSVINDGESIDISGGNQQNGTNIQIWSKNETVAQKWQIVNVDNGNYKIINPMSGKALDAAGAGVVDGTNVQLWEYNGTCAQLWKIMKSGDKYILISTCSGKTLDLANANAKDGNNIWLWSYNGTNAQKWQITALNSKTIDDGVYSIVSSLDDNKVVDNANANAKDGNNIWLWSYNGTNAQKWQITYMPEVDYYKIINPMSNKSLDVANAGTRNGTNLQLWEYNGTCAQLWKITKKGEYYIIASACSGLVLDVSWADTQDGNNIWLWSYNGTNAQRWQFEK